jgi:SNF2 family DNA or RNA helicase
MKTKKLLWYLFYGNVRYSYFQGVRPRVKDEERTNRNARNEEQLRIYRDENRAMHDFDKMVNFQEISLLIIQPDMEPSGYLATELMPHQTQGLYWMYNKETDPLNICKGGIIADDMGLGKVPWTLRVILKYRQYKPLPYY